MLASTKWSLLEMKVLLGIFNYVRTCHHYVTVFMLYIFLIKYIIRNIIFSITFSIALSFLKTISCLACFAWYFQLCPHVSPLCYSFHVVHFFNKIYYKKYYFSNHIQHSLVFFKDYFLFSLPCFILFATAFCSIKLINGIDHSVLKTTKVISPLFFLTM